MDSLTAEPREAGLLTLAFLPLSQRQGHLKRFETVGQDVSERQVRLRWKGDASADDPTDPASAGLDLRWLRCPCRGTGSSDAARRSPGPASSKPWGLRADADRKVTSSAEGGFVHRPRGDRGAAGASVGRARGGPTVSGVTLPLVEPGS
jgi:hypothetical protein